MVLKISATVLSLRALTGPKQSDCSVHLTLPEQGLCLLQARWGGIHFVEVFYQMVPIEDLPPLAWGRHLFDDIPDPVMPIAKTRNRAGQRLAINPLGQALIVLEPGPPGLLMQTDSFIFLPLTRLAQRGSQPNLAAIHA